MEAGIGSKYDNGMDSANASESIPEIPEYVDVIIIGAGPTGLTLACQLARHNLNFLIFDLQPKTTEECNLLLLHSKSLKYLNDLGVTTVRNGHIIKTIDTYVNSKLYSSMTINTTSSSIAPSSLVIDQSQLELLLENRLHNLGHSVLRPYAIWKIETFARTSHINHGGVDKFPSRISNQYGQNKFSSYLQQLVHTSTNEELTGNSKINETDLLKNESGDTCIVHIKKIDAFGKSCSIPVDNIRCRYVIGCDGMTSCVRKASEIDFEIAGDCVEYLFANISVSWGTNLSSDSISVLQTMQGGIVVVPMADNKWHIFCSRLTNLENTNEIFIQRESPDFQELQQILNTILPNTTLKELHSAFSYSCSPRLGTAFKKNEIILLGDAIHLYPPIFGYGANAGIMDVFNLAWKLAHVLEGANPKLLDTYETERREIVLREFKHFPNPVFDALANPSTSFRFLLALISSNLSNLDNFGDSFIKMIKESQSPYSQNALSCANKLNRYSLAPGSYFEDISLALVPIMNDSNLIQYDSPTKLSRFMQDNRHTLILALYVFPPGTKAQTVFGCRRNEEAVRWNGECITRLSKLARLLGETLRGTDYENSGLTILWVLCGLVNLKSNSNSVALENVKDHVPHRLKQFFSQKFRTNTRSHLLVDSENEIADKYQLYLSEPDSISASTKSGAFILLRPDGYICNNGYAGDSNALSCAFDYALNWFCS